MISRVSSGVPSEPGDGRGARRGSRSVIKDLAQLFKILADETRLKILDLLGHRQELCVRDLWERLGQSQPAVSHHLGLLRMAGLVDTRHEGKHIYYRIDQERFDELMSLIQTTRFGAQMLAHGELGSADVEPAVGTQSDAAPPDAELTRA